MYLRHNIVFLCCVFAAFFLPLSLQAETFAFKEKLGAKQRTISTVNEQVMLNGELLYETRILNRMTSEVKEIDSTKNGDTKFDAVFALAEERLVPDKVESDSKISAFQWQEDYHSIFSRSTLGKITIGKNVVMPTVRDVPLFPDKDLAVGETWTAPGVEAHDLGPTFGIKELFSIPFVATYKFLGDRKWRGKTYKTFSIDYTAEKKTTDYFEQDPFNTMTNGAKSDFKPVKVLAKSNQLVYWDSGLGQPVGANENFSLVFYMSDGNVYEFSGTAEAEIIESEIMDKDALSKDIEKKLQDAGIKDATVKIVEGGVSIDIENIQFTADSAILQKSEKAKLDAIGKILTQYPNRDILVSGHTALAGGSDASRMQLSQERAGAVAGYFINNKVRGKEHIMVRGWGSTKPIADNNTEEGKQKNRRVEITILEN
ncbi:MAG: OmpA family protein [Termitinemataceae bacterium]|nr:MAG: OmpA family protein [Termitinemataceae bacterium]